MANFNGNDSCSVDQILAQAMDHCVLEQVAAINSSSFSHSLPSSTLESRFQRLKTIPSTSKTKTKPQLGPNSVTEFNDPAPSSPCGYLHSLKLKSSSCDKKAKEAKSRSGSSNFGSKTTKTGFLWCNPKRVLRKKSDDSSDLKTLSLEEQKKMIKKTINDAKNIKKETKKIIKLAKQSARSDLVGDDDKKVHHFRLL